MLINAKPLGLLFLNFFLLVGLCTNAGALLVQDPLQVVGNMCDRGRYRSTTSDGSAAAICRICEVGFYCPGCPSARFCPALNVVGAIHASSPHFPPRYSCPHGSYSNTVGSYACETCQGEVNSDQFGNAIGCTINKLNSYTCQPGSYMNPHNRDTCEACPPCLPCPTGSVCPLGSRVDCSTVPGTEMPHEGGLVCIPCDVGTRLLVTSSNATYCSPCPSNTYQPLTGKSTCTACNVSTFSEAGSVACGSTCPAGTQLTASGCVACVAGKIGLSIASATATCTWCTGNLSSVPRSTQCFPCPVGSHTGGMIGGTCIYCAAGYYWSADSCKPSPRGTIALPGTGPMQPKEFVWCASGMMSLGGTWECTACRENYISRVDNSVCSKCQCRDCQLYMSQVTTVNNTCVCPDGFRLSNDEVTCLGCDTGNFREKAMYQYACLPCGIGQYGGGMGMARCEHCRAGSSTLFLGRTHESACGPSPCQSCSSADEVPVCTALGSQCQLYDQALPGGTLWPKGWYLSPHLRPIANMSIFFQGGVIRMAFADTMDKVAILYQQNGKNVVAIFSTSKSDASVGPLGVIVVPWNALHGEYVDIIWAVDSNSMYCVRSDGGMDLYQQTPGLTFQNSPSNDIQRDWISATGVLGHGAAVTPSAGFPACNLLSNNVLVCAMLSLLPGGAGNRTLFTKISILNDVATVASVGGYVPYAAKRNSVVVVGRQLCFVADGSGSVIVITMDSYFNVIPSSVTYVSPAAGSLLGGMQVRLRTPKRMRTSAIDTVFGVRSDGVWSNRIVNGLTPTNDAIGIAFSQVDDFAMLTSGHLMVASGEMISMYQHITSCPEKSTTRLDNTKMGSECVCDIGQYNDGTGKCMQCTPCRNGHYVTAECTANTNTVCRACSQCSAGNWTQQQCQATSDTVCSTCLDPACGDGTWQSGGCSGTELNGHRQCTQCSQCQVDEYVVSYNGCTNGSKTSCAPCGSGCTEVRKFVNPERKH